jgi:excisionase family DNA binding protein
MFRQAGGTVSPFLTGRQMDAGECGSFGIGADAGGRGQDRAPPSSLWCDIRSDRAARRPCDVLWGREGTRVNLKTAARRLGVHYQTAYRWVRSGQLVAIKVGAGYEISDAALARFQAQRAAMERVPDAVERNVAAAPDRQAEALRQLEEMVGWTTLDATAMFSRAAHALADTIGDAATVSLREPDGTLRLVAFDHRDPERAVAMGTMLRFGTSAEPLYAREASERGEAVFVPQVPQRDVRSQVRPEFHQTLTTAGFYSAVSAPIVGSGPVRGSVLVSRDTPGRPYTLEDRDFVVCVASSIDAAIEQAERGHRAWEVRRRLARELSEWIGHGDFTRARDWLLDEVADDQPVAIIGLDMVVAGATTAFAEHFRSTACDLKEQVLHELFEPSPILQTTFERLRDGELDYCTVVAMPGTHASPPVVLDGAIIRLADATPCCVLFVVHGVPEVVRPGA